MIRHLNYTKDGSRTCLICAGKIIMDANDHVDRMGTGWSRTYTTTMSRSLSTYDLSNLESIHRQLQESMCADPETYVTSAWRLSNLLRLISSGKVAIWLPYPERRVDTLMDLPDLYNELSVK